MFAGETLSLSRNENGIASLVFDRKAESVNKFDALTVSELGQALDVLEADDSTRGLLISSAKKVFVVGADIGEFTALFKQGGDAIRQSLEKNNQSFRRLEKLSFPVVVAINGFALGGGLEVCLACDVRVASTSAAVGLPETGLGIIPGWGGTARLPRIAGVNTALEWTTTGRQQKIASALEEGVVDVVVESDELQAKAEALLADCISGEIDHLARRALKESASADILAEAKAVAEQWRTNVQHMFGNHLPAQVCATESILNGIGLSLDEAIAVEADFFVKAAETDQARALVGNFLSDQYLMKVSKQRAKAIDGEIKRVAVLGAGIMGGGIAYQSAFTGSPVIMKDIAQEGLDLGMKEANKLLSKRVKRGAMSEEKKEAILASISPTLDYGNDFETVDVVVEAVVENEKIKNAVLTELEDQVDPATIICSNTSSIPITSLALPLKRPQRFCGMHFFNPVHAMPLVEIIRGEKSSEDTINKAVAYALSLKKKPVVVNDCSGFLVNRLLFAYFAGFLRLVNDGADYEFVDRVMEKWGWPMGPAFLADVVGLDTMQHVDDVLSPAYERMQRDFPSWYKVIVEMDGLGQKNGKGFYAHTMVEGRPHKEVNPEARARIAELARPAAEFDEEEVVERMMIGMAIELAHTLEEGIVASPEEADIALLFGVGFPTFRGGLARWMDTIGLDNFVYMADGYGEKLGPLYMVTARQRAMAAAGETYYG